MTKRINYKNIVLDFEEWLTDMITPKPASGGGCSWIQSINPEIVLKQLKDLKKKYTKIKRGKNNE